MRLTETICSFDSTYDRLARYEDLIQRRPLLLNSVMLRQNPHNVIEWQKRVSLYEGKPKMVSGIFVFIS